MSVCLIWNFPVFAFSFGFWRYAPEDDPRAWFCRIRLGWFKIEATRRRPA